MSPAPEAPDGALGFFLDVIATRGGVWEQAGDTATVLLPEDLRGELDLLDELTVTADPEAAREDGALLLAQGHPILEGLAAAVLAEGDVGCCHLPWPKSALPGEGELIDVARAVIGVDHGRIDGAGLPPSETYLPVLRLGVLVTYVTSLEDRFQEREEVWVDGATGLCLPEPVHSFLSTRSPVPGRDSARPVGGFDLAAALAQAHALIDQRALARRPELARQSRRARDEELARAGAYYDAALASISARAATAAPERRQLLAAQADVTSLERQRRLAEIEEKFEPRHDVQPFRLHLVGLPSLGVAVRIRRGARAYPLTLRWILGARAFAPIICPHCGGHDGLVAGRERLGCRACLSRATTAPEPPRDAPRPTRLVAPAPGHHDGPAGSPAPPRHRPAPRAHGRSGVQPARVGATSRRPTGDPERVERLGDKLTDSFWETVALGQRWRRKDIVAHSPMAALAKLYGSEGPLRAIGMPPTARPVGVTIADTIPGAPSRHLPGGCAPHVTAGWIRTDQGHSPWVLRWQTREGRAVVGEVLPVEGTGNSIRSAEVLPRSIACHLVDPPQPRIELDPVAAAIWEETIAVEGLNFALRCLAGWWEMSEEAGVEDLGTAALAAGVIDHARGRSGLTRKIQQPSLLGPTVEEVARAADVLTSFLGAPRARPW